MDVNEERAKEIYNLMAQTRLVDHCVNMERAARGDRFIRHHWEEYKGGFDNDALRVAAKIADDMLPPKSDEDW